MMNKDIQTGYLLTDYKKPIIDYSVSRSNKVKLVISIEFLFI